MHRKADLHIHTYFSDGAYSPEQIVINARQKGLDIISITDHDTVDGLERAVHAGKKYGVEVIPGLEISTEVQGDEIHLLGYFIDYNNIELDKYLTFFKEERYHRAKRIVKKLNDIGVKITIEDVKKFSKFSAIGRPHIALAMLDAGYIKNFYEAFSRYIGDYGPAYEKKIHFSLESAVKLINDSGGLSFIAHPANMKESVISQILDIGIDGIETVHPSHSKMKQKFYKGIVSQYCLLQSGGSDFHGGEKNDESNFGEYFITDSSIDAMKQMLVRNSA